MKMSCALSQKKHVIQKQDQKMNITLITKQLGNLDYDLKEAHSTAILVVKTQPSETKFKFGDQSNKGVSFPSEIGDLNSNHWIRCHL